ncbi:MAG TPA: prolyl oligopeptidase family serine peptidase [Blastocatellia bacterium]|nr:prolyl oligopeptidase family serine peptidase [Blastocatellia bacterium]
MQTMTFRRAAARVLPLLMLASLTALAQDASQVLRTSVSFRTLKNSVKLDEEQRLRVEALEAKAREATAAGRHGDALRHYSHAMAILRNQPWTPARALGAALQIKPDRVVVDPGDRVELRLTQIFALEEPLAGKLAGSLALVPLKDGRPDASATATELRSVEGIDPDFAARPSVAATIPDLADGPYQLSLTLRPAGGEPVVKTTSLLITRKARAESAALKARAAVVAAELQKKDRQTLLREIPAVEYRATLVSLADAGQIAVERLDLRGELAMAASVLEGLAKGDDPLRAMRGDVRWAYRSEVDGELQPYRFYVPTKYDPAKKYPLVVALHGMGGDENSYFTFYDNGVIKREAEARGYLVACPKGRGPASMYLGSAERDVLDVIAAMKRDYSVDPDRVYLTGHSMGGYGTWLLAANNPEIFAALAPVAGGAMAPVMLKLGLIAHIPQYVVHGDADPTVPVEESRKVVRAVEKLGGKVKYVEVPGGNHVDIVVPAMKDTFDWFDAHRRQPKGAAKAAGGNSQER